jgi:N-acetylmuramoyl-L-alanine amidase
MRRYVALLLPLTLACILVACATYDGSRVARWESRYHDSALGPVTPDQLLAEAHIKLDIIPSGTVGRRYYRPMNPRYITIHSTQNYTGNAYQHALARAGGAR